MKYPKPMWVEFTYISGWTAIWKDDGRYPFERLKKMIVMPGEGLKNIDDEVREGYQVSIFCKTIL